MTTEAASMTGVRTGGTGVATAQALNKKRGVAASGTVAALTMVSLHSAMYFACCNI